ncbi:MAG: twin-arginine translocase subunit TatC [Faecousia sp.]
MKKKTEASDGSMTLSGHLRELRNRILVVLAVFIAGVVVCFSSASPIVELLTGLGEQFGYQFVYIRPQELLMVYFTISLLGALVLALPVIAYEIFAFCSPGLKQIEKSMMLLGMIFGSVFFVVGVLFAYFVTVPFMLRFLIAFSTDVAVTASISIEEYMSFLLTVFTIFGVIFELPVLSVILTALGVVKPNWLVKARRAMIVVIFFLAAIITPPDIVSQIMVAIPIIALYEFSILLSKLVYRVKKKKTEE